MANRNLQRSEAPLPLPAGLPEETLRIAVDLSTMRPGGANGGVKPFILEYLRVLSALQGPKITWIFLTWSCSHDEIRLLARPWDELVCVRVEAGDMPNLSWRNRETLVSPAPLDLLLKLKAHLLYSPLACMEFACPGVPVIVTVVDVLHRDYPATLPPPEIAAREQSFQKMRAVASRFQCISDYTASRLIEHYRATPRQVFRSHIVIHDRLNRDAELETPSFARPYFFYPANAWAHKNHLTLLVAFRLFRRAVGADAWDLVLTGHDDEAMRKILTAAKTLGLDDCVHFRGHLPPDEFSSIWAHAGALVFPSLHEGFGIPLLEAMHFQIAILSSSAGSLPEVAGDAALYVDCQDPMALADGLSRIAQDADLRAQLIAAGQRRLADFSLESEAAILLAAMRDAASGIDAPVWTKGVSVDGWIENQAILGLPAQPGVSELELVINPIPAPRRLRVYLGETPLGGYDIPAGEKVVCRFPPVLLDGRPLLLEVPDAANLNPNDHRRHGILVENLRLINERGDVRNFNCLQS